MKTTLYVMVDQFVRLGELTDWRVDRAFVRHLRGFRGSHCVVAVFSPHRFGLAFESQDEAAQAWDYVRCWLRRQGAEMFDDVLLAGSASLEEEIARDVARRGGEAAWLGHASEASFWAGLGVCEAARAGTQLGFGALAGAFGERVWGACSWRRGGRLSEFLSSALRLALVGRKVS